MTTKPDLQDPRLPLAIRVGVTGHRKLPDADAATLAAAVERVLDDIASAAESLEQEGGWDALYRTDEKPLLQMVSPLAEGGDRLLAAAALKREWRSMAPLPFFREEYEKDFACTVEDFRRLLKAAEEKGQVVELDGSREDEDASYLRVGRFTLRHSDILLTIWNGEGEAGVGGTGQIVREAGEHGIPVIRIDSRVPHAISLREGGTADFKPYEPTVLRDAVRRLLTPFESEFGDEEHLTALRAYTCEEPVGEKGAAPNWLYAGRAEVQPSLLERSIGWIFPALIGALASKRRARRDAGVTKPPSDLSPPGAAEDNAFGHYYGRFQRTDALATHYANVHRSAFVLVYLLGAAALSCAVAALYWDESAKTFAAVELVLLLLVLGLVMVDRRRRWQDRWLDYRLLAELLRVSDVLSLLGRPFPHRGLRDIELDLVERGWVVRYYLAVVRAAGLLGARYTPDYLRECRDYVRDVRVQDQLYYHAPTALQYERVNRALRAGSEAFFGLTVVVVALKLAAPEIAHSISAGLLAGVFPSIAYGLFFIRNQAEFEIVVRRSERMKHRLERQRDALNELDDSNLTSEVVGSAILAVASVMRHDVVDWTGIFDVKETEAG